uniref:Uncharacterized protein n=1 Tax=Rhizophora mucronata TaxID=61149 RepID=A0A2P2P426_RHIMU
MSSSICYTCKIHYIKPFSYMSHKHLSSGVHFYHFSEM